MSLPSRRSVLFVVLVIVLAGCVGDTSPTTTTTTTSSTPTTTDVPPTSSPGTGDRPPGIDETRIVDFDALCASHEESLLADGGALTFSSRLVRPDGTLDQASNLTYRFGPGASHISISGIERASPETRSTIDLYIDESNQTLRRESDGTIEYAVRPRAVESETIVWANLPWYIEQYTDVLRVNESRSDGGTVVLDASIDQFQDVPGNESVVLMVVSESGVVTRFEHRQAYPGDKATYVREFVVRQVGGVTVTPPAWIEDVPPSASLLVDLFSSITEDGALQLEHVGGGDPVPPGTLVQLEADGTVQEATVPTAIAPGESMYVYLDPAGVLRVAEVPPTSEMVQPLPGEFTARVVTADGVTLFEESLGWQPPQQSSG